MALSQDVRYGIRVLLKSPGFLIVAVLSLALGIGANTTIFTMVNSIFLQPLPVEKPGELMYVYGTDAANRTSIMGTFLPISYPNFADYRAQNNVFAEMGAYSFPVPVSLAGGEKPTPILGQLVTGNYFSLLGVHIAIGRGFIPEEDRTPGTHAVAVLNYKFWQRQFGGNSGIVGQTIRLNGHPFTVIGVAPSGFEGTISVLSPDVWLPVMSHPHVILTAFPGGPLDANRRLMFFNAFGRLKASATMEESRAALQTIGKRLEQEFPTENTGRNVGLMPLLQATIPPAVRGVALQGSVLLMVIVGLVLLIACANLANLMMARATARRREFTVRVALGSARSRLISQLLTESVLVALPGGILAILVAVAGRNLILSLLPNVLNANNFSMPINATVLAFTFFLSIASGIIFGLVPALRASNPDLVTELKERSGSFAPIGRINGRKILVFVQVALSVIALASAGLFIRSLANAQNVDLGFDKDKLVVAGYDVSSNNYDQARGKEFHRQALEKLRGVPGVDAVALAAAAPLTPSLQRTVFPEGQENANNNGVLTFVNTIVPGYFETVRMPILRGRGFTDADREGGILVVVINEAMAKRFWPDQDALGKRFKFFADKEYRTVVGIVKTSKYLFIGEDPQSMAYLPLEQSYSPTMTLHVRVAGQPEAMKTTIERELRSIDRDIAVTNVSTGPELLRTSLWGPRLAATLLSIFGVIALVLATVGIYGVMSYSVNQRASEIGIRIALGAERQDVLRMVLRQGMTVVVLGLFAGLTVAVGVGTVMSRLLYGVGKTDLPTFGTTTLVLLAVALVANYIPARRATTVDPVTVMRYE